MEQVLRIVNQLENTSSTKEKQKILAENKDNTLLKKILFYTYNENKYGMTRDTINPNLNPPSQPICDMFSLLDCLATNNINDSYRQQVNDHLGMRSEEERELWIRVLTKDLRCNISVKTIQKVFPDMFPKWGCMLAQKYFDNEKYVEGKDFTLTMKMDGFRAIFIKQGDNIQAFTRQHKPYEGLNEIVEELKTIDVDFVVDGELLISNYKEVAPEIRYKLTSNIVRKDGDKTGVNLIVFDILPLEDFNKGICDIPYEIRRLQLETVFSNTVFIQPVEKVYSGNDTSAILPLLDKYTSVGEEGLMLNINNSPYECKRTKELLKLKKMQTCDLEIIGFEEGDGRLKGTLGKVIVDYKGNEVGVGSGYSDADREYIWTHQDELLGRVIEVSYFEETTSAKSDKPSLRFPVFKQIREEGKEVSYN